jgi:hypothetical protein
MRFPKSNRPWQHMLATVIGAVVVTFLLGVAGTVACGEEDPQDVKVLLLRHFPDYVEWPRGRFARDDSPFVVGVIGENPFGTRLQELVNYFQIKKRKIELRLVKEVNEIRRCHMLFVSASEQERLGEILKKAEEYSVLTVSDMRDFIPSGGMIQLCQKEQKIRFEINQRKCMAAKLVLDTRLSNMAKPCGSGEAP